MLNKTIHLHKELNTASLTTRQTATEIASFINDLDTKQVELDFTSIQYASRSFFDQLHYHLEELKKENKEVKLSNMAPFLEQLYRLVLTNKRPHSQLIHKDFAEIEATKVITL